MGRFSRAMAVAALLLAMALPSSLCAKVYPQAPLRSLFGVPVDNLDISRKPEDYPTDDGTSTAYLAAPERPAHHRPQPPDPSKIPVVLIHGPRSYPMPDEGILKKLYGEVWRKSPPMALLGILEKNEAFRAYLREMLAIEGVPIRFAIVYDDDALLGGEDLNLSEMKTTIVEDDMSLEDFAAKVGAPVRTLKGVNPTRFGVLALALSQKQDRYCRARDDHCSPRVVLLGSSFWKKLERMGSVLQVLAHEVAHTQQRGVRSEGDDYGPDGIHDYEEVTGPETAWLEAWAEYNEAQFSPSTRLILKTLHVSYLKREVPRDGSSPDDNSSRIIAVFDPTFHDYLSNEGSVAAILWHLEAGDPAGRARIRDAFYHGNVTLRCSFLTFVHAYLSRYPDELERLALLVDSMTHFSASTEKMRRVLAVKGVSAKAVERYLAKRTEVGERWLRKNREGSYFGSFVKKWIAVLDKDRETNFELSQKELKHLVGHILPDISVENYFAELREAFRTHCHSNPPPDDDTPDWTSDFLLSRVNPRSFVAEELPKIRGLPLTENAKAKEAPEEATPAEATPAEEAAPDSEVPPDYDELSIGRP